MDRTPHEGASQQDAGSDVPDACWRWLQREGAAHDVVQWAQAYGSDFERLWRECPRGDWLLAIAARLGAEAALLVLAASRCARLALAHVPEDELRPLRGLEAAEGWIRGELPVAACEAAKREVSEALEQAADPASGAAIVACMCVLDALQEPFAAVNAAAFAAEAAVLDAGDCAMMEALRFSQHEAACGAREAIPEARALALWQARES